MGIDESVFGLAYGDAMGKPTEFMPVHAIERLYGKGGPRDLPPAEKRTGVTPVTDDTQMALEVGEMLLDLLELGYHAEYSPVADVLTKRFVDWYGYTDGSRAPGGACMAACGRMRFGKPWWEATGINSKGCGANMRVTPVGLATWLTPEERAGIAQLQAAMTHAHPTALAAADATQQATWLLLTGTRPEHLLDELLDYVSDQAKVYHRDWLGELWMWTYAKDEMAYIRKGWQEVRDRLLDCVNAMHRPRHHVDPCLATGDGWTAEEALATALHSFLLYPDDAVAAIRRAACTRGDSDSIAALAGAFAGASLGPGCWPVSWRHRIEYADRLTWLAHGLGI